MTDITTDKLSSKIVLLGQSGVGKSALAHRLTGDEFYPTESTQGTQSYVLQTPGDEDKQPVIFELGSEKSRNEILSSLKEIDPSVALLLVDPNRDSELRENIKTWKTHLIDSKTDTRSTQMLVASRIDVVVGTAETSLEELAREFNFDGFFKTSAKTTDGIQELRAAVVEATRPKDEEVESDSVARVVQTMVETLCRLVAKDSKLLEQIEWRELERIIAVALDAIGFTVELTPGSKDGGKDVVAKCLVRNNEHIFYIEIKHWRKGDRPGPIHVYSFIELNARDATDGGLFLSSSGFTNGVYSQLGEISKQKVRLGDREKIVHLCQHFVRRKEGMWYPAQPLPELLFEDTLN